MIIRVQGDREKALEFHLEQTGPDRIFLKDSNGANILSLRVSNTTDRVYVETYLIGAVSEKNYNTDDFGHVNIYPRK